MKYAALLLLVAPGLSFGQTLNPTITCELGHFAVAAVALPAGAPHAHINAWHTTLVFQGNSNESFFSFRNGAEISNSANEINIFEKIHLIRGANGSINIRAALVVAQGDWSESRVLAEDNLTPIHNVDFEFSALSLARIGVPPKLHTYHLTCHSPLNVVSGGMDAGVMPSDAAVVDGGN